MPPRATRPDLLADAMRSLQRALAPRARGLGEAGDPLQLALSPCPPGALSEEGLSAWAALYLHAELDEAGVLPAVEALAEHRHALALQDRRTAERLERFARTARDYPRRADRARIYARLFGIGDAATAQVRAQAAGGAWGHEEPRLDFTQQLLRLATAAVRADLDRSRLGAPGLRSQAAWRVAAQDMLASLRAQAAGSLVAQARRIHARTLQAFELLGDAGLKRQLVSRTPWESLRRLLPGEGAARRDAAARRGAVGQVLLCSLARAQGAEVPDNETVQAALRWLVASGLPVPKPAAGDERVPGTAFAAGGARGAALPGDTWTGVAA